MMKTRAPVAWTPYPDVDALLAEVLEGAREILGARLVGMYLDGSLATGGFDAASDIDFVAVLDSAVTEGEFLALQMLHDRIATLDAPLAIQLEGFYVPAAALRDEAMGIRCPNLERGPGERLKWVTLDAAWAIHRYVLYNHGVTIAGPDPRTIVDPVAPSDLRGAAEGFLEWLSGLTADSVPMASRGYQSYVVLTVCRILYTLAHADVASKSTAVVWARQTLDARWHWLIDEAVQGRHSGDGPPLPGAVAETLAFIETCVAQQR